MLQKSAESLAALHFAGGERQHSRLGVCFASIGKWNVTESLMRTFFEIMCDEAGDEMVEVSLTADKEVVQTLGFEGLDESLHCRIHVLVATVEPADPMGENGGCGPPWNLLSGVARSRGVLTSG